MTDEELFELVLDAGPEDRPALLDKHCAGKPDLRARIEVLLDDLEVLPSRDDSTRTFVKQAEGTVVVGRYILVERIGEGGFGEVWVAKQSEPVRRKVALKLIRADRNSRSVVARFEQERQALALMDHPNIARVFDGGLTANGQPYLVMELVPGRPLTRFCDEAKLGVRERLELFVQVCRAVQHAHQKGVVHRDLKPANILVTLVDGRPTPKVIDFGVAKAVSGKLTAETLSTHFGAVVGTLEYMAPEQAGVSIDDVDTRADIYALGVVLYELLTGLRPFDATRLRKAALDEIVRVIREEEPPSLSSRLSSDESLPSAAALRGVEPKRLLSLFKGELDWIVLRCLEKDRNRRYESASGLGRDVERFLNDEPVEARPVSAGYRLRKLLRRHRGAVAALFTVFATLVLGVAGTTWGLFEARRQEDDARKQQKRAEKGEDLAEKRLVDVEAEKRRVEKERGVATAVSTFLQKKLLVQAETRAQANALLAAGGTAADAKLNPTIRELLDRAAEELNESRIEANFPKQPEVQAALLRTVGSAYGGVGEDARSIEFLARGYAIFKVHRGPDHPDTLENMRDLSMAYRRAGRFRDALALGQEAWERAKAALGPENSGTLDAMNIVALSHGDLGDFEQAVAVHEEVLRLYRKTLGDDRLEVQSTMNNLATALLKLNQVDRALPLLEHTLNVRKAKLGSNHPNTWTAMSNLANALSAAKQYDRALALEEEAFRLRKERLGAHHPRTLTSMNNLAYIYYATKKYDKALPLMEKQLELTKAKAGPDHPETLTSMNNLAQVYASAERRDKSLPLLEETLRLRRAKLGPDHPDTLESIYYLGVGYRDAGKRDQALPHFEEAFRLRKAKLGPDHRDTLTSMNNLATNYFALGMLDKALPLLEEALALCKVKFGPDHAGTLSTMNNLGAAYLKAEILDKALPLLQEVVRRRKETLGPSDAATLSSMNLLASAYSNVGKFDDSLPLLEEVVARWKAKAGSDNPETLEGLHILGRTHLRAGNHDKGERVL